MKQDLMPSVVQMDAETFKKLTSEVQETLAKGIVMPAKKRRFTVVSLWKIHQAKIQPARLTRKWAI